MSEGFFAFDMHKYQAAAHAAPPNTWITLGSLEVEMVECTTCRCRMESRAAQFHTHPVACLNCGCTYDANVVRHDTNHVDRPCGAGTIGHATGCTVVTL